MMNPLSLELINKVAAYPVVCNAHDGFFHFFTDRLSTGNRNREKTLPYRMCLFSGGHTGPPLRVNGVLKRTAC